MRYSATGNDLLIENFKYSEVDQLCFNYVFGIITINFERCKKVLQRIHFCVLKFFYSN